MCKIRLLIADSDTRYIDKLSSYINLTYRSRIKVSAFTRAEALQNFLTTSQDKADILLASPDFLRMPSACYENIRMVIALSDGSLTDRAAVTSVSKYQPGDKIINQLLDLYAQEHTNAARVAMGENNTRIISVYSPAGGSGKTSVTIGLASLFSRQGKAVLCLSLESVNSMVAGLTPSENEAFSHIMLSLAENEALLPLKLEMYKTRDETFGFNFIEPPRYFIEMSESGAEDLSKLLATIKNTGLYDYMLIDMDSAADQRALAVLEASDKVVLICTPGQLAGYKIDSFLQQYKKITSTEGGGLLDKLLPVMNKNNEGLEDLAGLSIDTPFRVPFIPDLWYYNGVNRSFDSTGAFTNNLSALARAILQREAVCR